MESKHTPGTWIADKRSNGGHEIFNKTTRQGIASTIPLPRYNGRNMEESRMESFANANLIAAAPDMLVALQVLRDGIHPGMEEADIEALQAIISTVLAKATNQ